MHTLLTLPLLALPLLLFLLGQTVRCLSCCAQALRSLVSNEAVQLEPYLHQIMPFILTCMVGKHLGVSFMDGVTLSEQHLTTFAV